MCTRRWTTFYGVVLIIFGLLAPVACQVVNNLEGARPYLEGADAFNTVTAHEFDPKTQTYVTTRRDTGHRTNTVMVLTAVLLTTAGLGSGLWLLNNP